MNLFACLRAWFNRKPGLAPMPPMPLAEIAARRKLGMPPRHPEKLATVLTAEDEAWLERVDSELWGAP